MIASVDYMVTILRIDKENIFQLNKILCLDSCVMLLTFYHKYNNKQQ
jgi:hypothetical protein